MSRSDDFKILLNHTFSGSTSFQDISLESSDESDIIRCIDIDLQIHQIPHALVIQNHQTLDNDKMLGLHMNRFVHPSVMNEIILRHFNSFTLLQPLEMLDKKISIESIRLVEVERCDLVVVHIFSTAIVIILSQEHKFLIHLGNLSDNSSLSASASSRDTNDFYWLHYLHISFQKCV